MENNRTKQKKGFQTNRSVKFDRKDVERVARNAAKFAVEKYGDTIEKLARE